MGEAFITRRGGGSLYSLLTITTEAPELEGCAVTVTGTDSATGKVDRQSKTIYGGTAEFKLKFLTTYTITATSSTGASTEQVIDVPYYAPINISLVLWDGGLYIRGEEYEAITGGWISEGLKSQSSSSNSTAAPTITRGQDYIKFSQVSARSGIARTSKKIDLTPYSKIVFYGKTVNTGDNPTINNWALRVWTKIGSYAVDNSPAGTILTKNNNNHTEELDISNVTGECYVGFLLNCPANFTAYIEASEIRLVR